MPFFMQSVPVFTYFSAFFVLTILSVLSSISENAHTDKFLFMVSAFVTVAFYGFRHPGTPDIIMYMDSFDGLGSFDDFEWGSYGFFVVMKVFKLISDDNAVFIFLSSSLFVSLVSICIIKYLGEIPYKSLAMISFACGWFMLDLATNTYRQGLALPLVMLYFFYLYKNKFIASSLYAVAAFCIHWGAVIPVAIGLISIFIARRVVIVKMAMVLTALLFLLSFVTDMNLAKLAFDSLTSSWIGHIFVGVNITTKMQNYLNAEVDGAMFYQSDLLRKIKFTIEAFLPLLVNLIFILMKEKEYFKNHKLFTSTATFMCLTTLYAVMLISMSWFFRNFYWMPMLSVFVTLMMIHSIKAQSTRAMSIILYSSAIIVVSLLSNWTSELLKLSYPL